MSNTPKSGQQTMEHGRTLADKAKALGVYTPGPQGAPDLRNMTLLVFGRPRSGKSSLFSADPDILRLDFDRKGPTPDGVGPIWPPADKPFSWDTVKTDLPKVLAALQPRMVVIDTLTSLVETLKEWVGAKTKQSFHDMDQRRAWPPIYAEALWLQNAIKDAGCHPVVLVHLQDTTNELPDGRLILSEEPAVTKGMWRQLCIKPDLMFWLVSEDIEETVPLLDAKGNPQVDVNGKPKTRGTGQFRPRNAAVFKADPKRHAYLSKVLRGHPRIPDEIELPFGTSLSDLATQFADAYNASA